jgi:hypothetical protein
MFISCHHNAVQNHNLLIAKEKRALESMAKFKYSAMTVTSGSASQRN